MLLLISFLWSFWSAPSVDGWWRMIVRAGSSGLVEWSLFALVVTGAIALGIGLQWGHGRWRLGLVGPNPPFGRSAVFTGATGTLLLVIGQPAVQDRLTEGGPFGDDLVGMVSSLQVERLNEADAVLVDRGYYEGLLTAPSFLSALWRARVGAPPGRDRGRLEETEAGRTRDDLLRYELRPGVLIDFQGVSFTTNEWGMRDREGYLSTKPPLTYRIALMGSSYSMGWGVPLSSTFETLAEERLNRERPWDGFDRYEILNFSVARFAPARGSAPAPRAPEPRA